MLGFGEHFGIGLQQLPSGSGPLAHLPPAASLREQFQRPFFITGRHSATARQTPPLPGPTRQGLPSANRPQTQSWFGRS